MEDAEICQEAKLLSSKISSHSTHKLNVQFFNIIFHDLIKIWANSQ